MPNDNRSETSSKAATKFWLMQQGARFWIEESAAIPAMQHQEGERVIVQRGAFNDRATAEARKAKLSAMTTHQA